MVQHGILRFGGGYYAVLLAFEKGIYKLCEGLRVIIPSWIQWFLTIFLVAFGWAIFMADGYSMRELFAFLSRLFVGVEIESRVTVASMNLYGYLPYIVLGSLISFPTGMIIDIIGQKLDKIQNKGYAVIHDLVLMGLLILCIVYIVGGSYNPFIYYRF